MEDVTAVCRIPVRKDNRKKKETKSLKRSDGLITVAGPMPSVLDLDLQPKTLERIQGDIFKAKAFQPVCVGSLVKLSNVPVFLDDETIYRLFLASGEKFGRFKFFGDNFSVVFKQVLAKVDEESTSFLLEINLSKKELTKDLELPFWLTLLEVNLKDAKNDSYDFVGKMIIHGNARIDYLKQYPWHLLVKGSYSNLFCNGKIFIVSRFSPSKA